MYCAVPGCPALVARGRCRAHAQALERGRPNRDVRRWYYTARWIALRRLVLERQPLCVDCQKVDRVEPAIDVIDIEPAMVAPPTAATARIA